MLKGSENEIELARSLSPLKWLSFVALFISVAVIGGWYLLGDSGDAPIAFDAPSNIEYQGCLAVEGIESDECILVEVVREREDLTLGLSGRTLLEGGTGLLFDFGVSGRHCMWMKDMNFGLDMVWLDDQKRITAIEESVSPKSFPNSFCGGERDRYVLEVNEGVVSELGFSVGQRVNW